MHGFNFPEGAEEAKDWQPVQRRVMLNRQVMVVARTRIEGRWSAYCFPVPGENHDNEEYLWESEGAKLPKEVAVILFKDFAELPYAN